MKFPFIVSPDSGKPDEFVTIAMIITMAVVFRFLVDGSTWNILGHVFTFSKLDASIYVALLGPALASHSYTKVNGKKDLDDEKS